MRFFEIASKRIPILATKRFIKNAAFYTRGYPAVEKTLRDFLLFKTANPREQFGKKDTPFTGGPLVGRNHVHLFHGKVILVYDVRDGALRLFDVVEHNGFERSGVEAMAKYIRTATLEPVQQPVEAKEIPAETKAELDNLFYEIAVQERDVIDTALEGDWEHLFDYIRMVIDESEASDSDVFDAFGGQAGLAEKLADIMKKLGYK